MLRYAFLAACSSLMSCSRNSARDAASSSGSARAAVVQADAGAFVNAGEVRRTIARINDQTSRWWDAGLLDSIAGTYVEDATMLEPNELPIRGREAIRKRLIPGKASDSVTVHLRSTSDEVRVADTIAVEQGHFVEEVRRKPPADTTKVLSHARGNYLTIWVFRAGAWRILYDMDASEPDTTQSRTKSSR